MAIWPTKDNDGGKSNRKVVRATTKVKIKKMFLNGFYLKMEQEEEHNFLDQVSLSN